MGRATSTVAAARFTKPHFTSLAEFVRARKNFLLSFKPFTCSLLPGPERSDLNARLRRHTLGSHQLDISSYISSDISSNSSDISYSSTWGEIDNDFGERY
jgi:hypothetical protein